MGRIKVVLGLAAVLSVIVIGGQVGLAEWTNLQLQDDLRDISSSLGPRIGLADLQSDEDLRNLVIRKAEGHGISLEPKQVTVRRAGSGVGPAIYLAVDYNAPIHLPGYSFTLRFMPSSEKKSF
jgi:hypothetical protein